MLTDKQIRKIRKAIRLISDGSVPFSCHAVDAAQDLFCGQTNGLREKYARFYGFPDLARWGDLPCFAPDNTPETQLQRELMLEFFAQTKGVL